MTSGSHGANTPGAHKRKPVWRHGPLTRLIEVRDPDGSEVFHVTMKREFVWGPDYDDSTGPDALARLFASKEMAQT